MTFTVHSAQVRLVIRAAEAKVGRQHISGPQDIQTWVTGDIDTVARSMGTSMQAGRSESADKVGVAIYGGSDRQPLYGYFEKEDRVRSRGSAT